VGLQVDTTEGKIEKSSERRREMNSWMSNINKLELHCLGGRRWAKNFRILDGSRRVIGGNNQATTGEARLSIIHSRESENEEEGTLVTRVSVKSVQNEEGKHTNGKKKRLTRGSQSLILIKGGKG